MTGNIWIWTDVDERTDSCAVPDLAFPHFTNALNPVPSITLVHSRLDMRSPATSRRAGRQHVPAPRPPRLQTVPLPPVPLASSTSQHPRWQPPLSPLPPPSPLGFDAPTQPFTVFSKNPFTRKCNPTEMAALLALMRQVQASSRAASGAPRPLVDDQQRFNLFLALLVYTQAIVGLEEGAELPEALLADEGLRAGLAGMPTLIQDAMDWEARRKLWAIEQREVIFGCREKAVSPGGVVVDPAEYVETKWRLKVGNEEGLGVSVSPAPTGQVAS